MFRMFLAITWRYHRMTLTSRLDYDFANISTPASLIDQMANAGGFTATKLATARNILQDMKRQIDEVDGDAQKVCNWISFPACFVLLEQEVSSLKELNKKCSMLSLRLVAP